MLLSSHGSVLRTQFFWDVTLLHELICRRFERTYCLHIHNYVPLKRRESIAQRRAFTSQKNGVVKVVSTELFKRFLAFKHLMFITVSTKALQWATWLYFTAFPYFTFYPLLHRLPLYFQILQAFYFFYIFITFLPFYFSYACYRFCPISYSLILKAISHEGCVLWLINSCQLLLFLHVR